jgi:hypothetical protein
MWVHVLSVFFSEDSVTFQEQTHSQSLNCLPVVKSFIQH